MKKTLTILATLLFLLAAHEALGDQGHHSSGPSSQAAKEPEAKQPTSYTCKYISGDVGTIIGVGDTPHAAQANAAEKCFDRRVSLFENVRGQNVDLDRGQDFIDACVNLTCS